MPHEKLTPMVKQVLFICTGNSARSVLAEGLLNHLGAGRFVAHSAGSQPTGRVNPLASSTLRSLGAAAEAHRSKSWDEFAAAGAPPLDFIFTVCDSAAGEACPYWPGHPVTAHWGLPDPAAVQGSDDDKARAFMATALVLRRRIERLLELPIASLDAATLQARLRDIGQIA